MHYTQCDACGKEFLNDQLTEVDGELLCPECAEAEPDAEAAELDSDGLDHDGLAPDVDENEANASEASVAGVGRPLPGWAQAVVVASVLVVVALAAYGVFHGVRVMRANAQLRQAKELFFSEKSDVSGALAAVRRAREILPGDREILAYGNFFAGVAALYREDNEQAVAGFAAVDIPLDEQEWSLNSLRTQAQMNLAFDQKKYEASMALALQMLEKEPDDPMLLFQAASASAACYAQTGNEEFKTLSLEFLNKAGAIMAEAPEGMAARQAYETRRIQHRLETRQILSRREYEQQFGKVGDAATTTATQRAPQQGDGKP